jgi:hypothetical protein
MPNYAQYSQVAEDLHLIKVALQLQEQQGRAHEE